jgi:hypothetical protein
MAQQSYFLHNGNLEITTEDQKTAETKDILTSIYNSSPDTTKIFILENILNNKLGIPLNNAEKIHLTERIKSLELDLKMKINEFEEYKRYRIHLNTLFLSINVLMFGYLMTNIIMKN